MANRANIELPINVKLDESFYSANDTRDRNMIQITAQNNIQSGIYTLPSEILPGLLLSDVNGALKWASVADLDLDTVDVNDAITTGTFKILQHGAGDSNVRFSTDSTPNNYLLGIDQSANKFKLAKAITMGSGGDILTIDEDSAMLSRNNALLTPSITLQQNGAGDTAIAFQNPVDGFIMGIDRSDSNRFKISHSSQLGINDVFTVAPTGDLYANSIILPTTQPDGSAGLITIGTTQIAALNFTNNLFIGASAGLLTVGGNYNVAFGASTLGAITSGEKNSAFGYEAGKANNTGSNNVFLGYQAGIINTSGNSNICLGSGSNMSSGTLINASAIGYGAVVDESNKMQFGASIAKFAFDTAIFTLNELTQLKKFYVDTVGSNYFLGSAPLTPTGTNNVISGGTGAALTTGSNNTLIGRGAGNTLATGSDNTVIGYNAHVDIAGTRRTAIGYAASSLVNDGLVLGDTNVKVGIRTTSPTEALTMIGNADITGNISITGTVDGVDVSALAGTVNQDIINLSNANFSGWVSWLGAGNYYSFPSPYTTFTLLRGGTGYIKSTLITWAAGGSVAISPNTTEYIYINNLGILGKTSPPSSTLYEDYIVLFAVLWDGNLAHPPIIKQENHPYKFGTTISNFFHDNLGSVIRGMGAQLTAIGANDPGDDVSDEQLKIMGSDTYEDHGLSSTIPDSGGAAVSIQYWYLDSVSGKWMRYTTSTEIPMVYNQAGVGPTALTVGNFGIMRIFTTAQDLPPAIAPYTNYIAIMDTVDYASQLLAQTAITNGTVSDHTGELSLLEPAQLGYVITHNANIGGPYTGGAIAEIIIQKDTFNSKFVGGGSAGSHILLSDLNSGTYSDGGHSYLAQTHEIGAAPTVADDSTLYKNLSLWLNSTAGVKDAYMCVDNTGTGPGTAVWKQFAWSNLNEIRIGAGALAPNSSNSVAIGHDAGSSSTAGSSENVFLGHRAGVANTTGTTNTAIGSGADIGITGLNRTALGANSYAAVDNALVLGDVNTLVGIRTTAPNEVLTIVGNASATRLILRDAIDDSHKITFQVPNITSDQTWTLPATLPAAGPPVKNGFLGMDNTGICSWNELPFDAKFSGFYQWETGASAPYWSYVKPVFTVLWGGYGYVRGKKVTWTAGQTVNITVKAANYIMVNATGAPGANVFRTALVAGLYEDNVPLFEVYDDDSAGMAVSPFVKKENHPVEFVESISSFLHSNLGNVITGDSSSGNISPVLVGIGASADNRRLKITQATVEDHGLRTVFSAINPTSVKYYYTNAGLEWIQNTQDLLTPGTPEAPPMTLTPIVDDTLVPLIYNNAGTIAGITAGYCGIMRIYVTEDNLNTTTPQFVGVINNTIYPTLADANTAISSGAVTNVSSPLNTMEFAQLGYIIVRNSGTNGYIEETIIQKNTFNAQFVGGLFPASHLTLGDLLGGQYADGGHTYLATRRSAAAVPGVGNDDAGTSGAPGNKTLSLWLDTTTGANPSVYVNTINTVGAAVWPQLISGLSNVSNANLRITPDIITTSWRSALTGTGNTIVGKTSGGSLTTGIGNTIIGYNNMPISTDDTYNITLGWGSALLLNHASGNCVMGHGAFPVASTASNNVVIGTESGKFITTGSENIFIGHTAFGVDVVSRQISIGFEASCNGSDAIAMGRWSIAGAGAISIGDQSGAKTSSGTNSVLIGNYAGAQFSTGENICIGARTGYCDAITIQGTDKCVFIGNSSGSFITGDENTFIGHSATSVATYQVVAGIGNTGLGYKCGTGDGDSYNIAIGYQAYTDGGDYNIAIGYQALANPAATPAGIAIGYTAVCNSRYGIAMGYTANTGSGEGIIAIGYGVMGGGTSPSGIENLAIGYRSMYYASTAHHNTCMGAYTLRGTSSGTPPGSITGSYNTCVGYEAMRNSTSRNAAVSAANNTAIGYQALYLCYSGGSNVGIGYLAGDSMTTGSKSTFIGTSADTAGGDSIDYQLAVGYAATTANLGAIAMGSWASAGNPYSIAIGSGLADATTAATVTGDYGIAIGYDTSVGGVNGIAIGVSTTTGYWNSIAIGQTAHARYSGIAIGDTASSGSGGTPWENICIGNSSGKNGLTGAYNVAVGGSTMSVSATSGNYNTCMGHLSLYNLTTGSYNTCIGYGQGSAITTGSSNTVVGSGNTVFLNTGQKNTVFGTGNMPGQTDGEYNTIIGGDNATLLNRAGDVDASMGGYNHIIGSQSFISATKAVANVVLSHKGGRAITTGSSNVIVGRESGNTLTTGSNNILIGRQAECTSVAANNQISIGYGASTGATDSIAIGTSASTSRTKCIVIGRGATANNGISEGDIVIGDGATADYWYNIVIGTSAIAGYSSIAIGGSASAGLGGKWSSTAVGPGAVCTSYQGVAIGCGASALVGNYAVAVGLNAQATNHYTTAIGGGAQATGEFAVALGWGAVATTGQFVCGSASNTAYKYNGTATGSWTVLSDRRKKTKIAPCPNMLEKVRSIPVVEYAYKSNPNMMGYGFIAQDVESCLNERERNEFQIVSIDPDEEKTYNLCVQPLLVMNFKATQELATQCDHSQDRIIALETENIMLKTQIQQLQEQLNRVLTHLNLSSF